MKSITIIIGGSVKYYIDYIKLFDTIESHFNCHIKQTNPFKFKTKIRKKKFEIFFAKNPTRDKVYRDYQSYLYDNNIEDIPPPSDEVVQRIQKSEVIIFFGLCGGLKGKKNEIYLPDKANKLYFKDHLITDINISNISTSSLINIKNLFIGKISGIKSTVITSNVALCIDSMKRKESGLKSICRKLSNYGDIVDKEVYNIANYVKNTPLGVMLLCSDLLNNKKCMLKNGKPLKIDTKKFNQICLECIESLLQ